MKMLSSYCVPFQVLTIIVPSLLSLKLVLILAPFSNSKRLCCWAGLTPGNNESAGKKKSVRIARACVYLKPALVQVAHAAVKSDKSPYYKQKYERIMKRRGKKRAIMLSPG